MPTDAQYRQLLAFRTTLRHFEKWSAEAAAAHGVSHIQHQFLLAVRGSASVGGPTIGEVAEALLVKPHTAGELADRLSELGYVVRMRDDLDHRRVRLRLTGEGNDLLRSLTAVHLEELRRLRPLLGGLPDQ
ncbi:MarR family winged helix-turn-helix transcriptional regulator [Nocardioides cynanchi]|uniref:MarR family winged helix-turn-helix transcriptional regulator n=1 Tax=Nocardioides cynanchi TaxID=2558918 RepID=UPI00124858A5|nr:MarR family winged helix-turn-helix transcriptional regulator [Nocardioides cynanchi]